MWSSSLNDLLGKVGQITQGFVSSGGKWAPGGTIYNFKSRFPSLQFYAQDTWKINRRLNLNYGVRYDLYNIPNADPNSPLCPVQRLSH